MSTNETNVSPSWYILVGLGLVLGLFTATVFELYVVVTAFKETGTSSIPHYIICAVALVFGLYCVYRFMRQPKAKDPSKQKLFWMTVFCILARPAMYVIFIGGVVLSVKG